MSSSTSAPRRLGEPVRSSEGKVRAPPHDRIRRVRQVQHAGAGPGLRAWFDGQARVADEPDHPAVAEDGLHLGAAGVPPGPELLKQGIEVRRAGEQHAVGPVGQVGLAAERGLAGERPQTDPEEQQLGAIVGGALRPPLIHRVEQRPARLSRPGLIHQEREPGRQVAVLDGDAGDVAAHLVPARPLWVPQVSFPSRAGPIPDGAPIVSSASHNSLRTVGESRSRPSSSAASVIRRRRVCRCTPSAAAVGSH